MEVWNRGRAGHQPARPRCARRPVAPALRNLSNTREGWTRRRLNRLRIALLLTGLTAAGAAVTALAAEDFSPAERALFMSHQFASLKPPTTLRYSYTKSGSLEAGFEDRVAIKLSARANGKCCTASTDFLAGSRRLSLPEVEAADGNPVILYFLERDIREMSRLTKGKPNYFRKRIRMAVYQAAQVREMNLPYRGNNVAVRHITITPYLDDPLRSRFEKFATKQYDFTLSEAVPGGVYAIRTRISAESAGAAPLLVEAMVLEGASPAPPNPEQAKR